MEDKKQDVNLLEELSKAADEFRKWVVDFGDILAKALADIQTSKKEEDTWEMKCPYKVGEVYWILFHDGTIDFDCWDNQNLDRERLSQGNVFPTEEEALLEAKRRNLLTRFRAFRDECNGDWKLNWNKNDAKYYLYKSSTTGDILCNDIYFYETFPLFGYFKNEEDAQRAIELFGDEIKELFVDCEV